MTGSLVRLRPGSRHTAAVLLLPHAGGAAHAYAPVAARLPADLDVLGADLPGHGSRIDQPFATDLVAAAGQIGAEVAAYVRDPGIPVVVSGHSFGSLLGFEVVRALERMDVRVTNLVASSCPGPHQPAARPAGLHLLSHEGLLDLLVAGGGLTEEMAGDADLLEMLLPVVRNGAWLAGQYRPAADAKISAPVTVVRGTDEYELSTSDLDGWGEVTAAGHQVVLVPGGHWYPIEHPATAAGVIARALLARSR